VRAPAGERGRWICGWGAASVSDESSSAGLHPPAQLLCGAAVRSAPEHGPDVCLWVATIDQPPSAGRGRGRAVSRAMAHRESLLGGPRDQHHVVHAILTDLGREFDQDAVVELQGRAARASAHRDWPARAGSRAPLGQALACLMTSISCRPPLKLSCEAAKPSAYSIVPGGGA
jgi:hypothetical protein